MRASRVTLRLCVSLPLALATLAFAEPPGDSPAKPTTTPAPAGVLGGPKVSNEAKPGTLVERDDAGKLKRLEVRPEQAALDLLGLNAGERRDADKVLAERFERVSHLMTENYELFLKIQGARQGGAGAEEMAPLMRQFRPIAAPLLEKPLAQQVAAALPEQKREQFTKMVDEYKRALAADDTKAAPGGGEGRPGRRAVADPNGSISPRVEMNLLLREMGRSLKAIVEQRRDRTEQLVKAFEPTPEQEVEIRRIIRETGEKNGLRTSATPEQRGELMTKLLQVLTPEQRQKALENLRKSQ